MEDAETSRVGHKHGLDTAFRDGFGRFDRGGLHHHLLVAKADRVAHAAILFIMIDVDAFPVLDLLGQFRRQGRSQFVALGQTVDPF